jgi:hypothetical protein
MSTPQINTLLAVNALVWLIPPFFFKGLNRYYLLLLALVFSGSYWCYLPVHYYFNFGFSGDVVQEFIPDVLHYSVYAALSLYLGVWLVLKKKLPARRRVSFSFHNPLRSIPAMPRSAVCLICSVGALQVYSLVAAIGQVGLCSRVEFMENVAPLWYTTLLPLTTVLLCLLLLYEFRKPLTRLTPRRYLVLWFLLVHVVLVGFDGSRRMALPPILILGVATFFGWASGDSRIPPVRRLLGAVLLLFLFSSLLGINRDFNVGWQMFRVDLQLLLDYFPNIVSMIVAPMSTLHVNTEMAEFTGSNGIQGITYYLTAIGNTLFPRFIFGHYLFGEPLVVVLHERFGWYGQDFGFLAEAIYAGGALAVIVMHLAYGAVAAKVLNGIASGRMAYSVLGIGLLFGALNSLRSDFMNLLKATLYPALALYLVLVLFQKFNPGRAKVAVLPRSA